jgi:hypothetical protein
MKMLRKLFHHHGIEACVDEISGETLLVGEASTPAKNDQWNRVLGKRTAFLEKLLPTLNVNEWRSASLAGLQLFLQSERYKKEINFIER